VTRTYLDKGLEKTGIPNGKLRPIGAPNLPSKMLFKAIEIILRECLEPLIGEYQHGFMRNRGIQTATKELILKLRSHPSAAIYEFDLKSFFNKVNPIFICEDLTEIFGPIGDWIKDITVGNIPNIRKRDIKPEAELIVRHDVDDEGNVKPPIIHRYGFTQGSPLSPLLCAFALNQAGIQNIGDLIMFADDGVILSYSDVDLKKTMSRYQYEAVGIKLATDKP
jgi:retron-type reverse transcriptase